MARKVNIVLEDDLDHTTIEEGEGGTLTFALDGVNYEIDLNAKNMAGFEKATKKYVEAARKMGRSTVRSIGTARSTNRAATDTEAKAIREWAVDKGLMRADSRGRIPAAIKDQYAAR